MNINTTLEKIGLNEKEIKLYLTLLKYGKMKPTALAATTKISRPLVYNLAKNLLSKGFISEDISGKITHFTPLPPKSLEKLIDEAKRETKEKELLIRQAINDLSLLTVGKQYPVPKIRLIEEKDIEKFLFDNLTKWQDAILDHDGIWWGFQDHNFVEYYEKWIKSTWETIQTKNPQYQTKVFTNDSNIEQKLKNKYPKRQIRFLANNKFTATTWICGEYLIMIMTQEHPFYILEIHDKLIAYNTAEIFKHLWNNSENSR